MNNERKEWMYSFKGGGWNTEFATSAEEAYESSVDRWKDSSSLTPIESSFKLVEENRKEYESNLRMFW